MTPDISDEAIRETAYRKWQEAGQPMGEELSFWLAAERELLSQQAQEELEQDNDVDEASKESFPASDPPAWKMTTVGSHPTTNNKKNRRPRNR